MSGSNIIYMNETNQKLPQLKLADNIPVTIELDTQPEQAKEFPNKFDETKPTHMYFITATDPMSGAEGKHIWFATDRQHKELISRGALLGSKYEIVNRKMPGDKYATFIVRDVAAQLPVRSTSDDLPPLEEYLKDPEATQSIDSQDFAPINAVKTQAPNKQHADKQSMGMCFKIAGDWVGRGLITRGQHKTIARELYVEFSELTSE